jgi:hypothetical protein
MANLKLLIDDDDFEDIDCTAFAIHTNLEAFRLAYFLNKTVGINLKVNENAKVVVQKETKHLFSNYIFEDKKNDVFWNLIENENQIETQSQTTDLFATQETFITKIYFIPEHKKVNYFLKVEGINNVYDSEEILEKIKTINRISACYELDINNLKSKNNLIY